jgi:hypothetical protein
MNRPHLALVLLSLLVFPVGVLAQGGSAPVPNVREHQITVSSADETTPTLGNDGVSDFAVYTYRVVLPDGTRAPGDIWYQRLTPDGAPTGPAMQVSASPTDDELNDVSGDYIVYTAFVSTTSSQGTIMLYRVSTGTGTPLAQAQIAREARIYGNNVVWVEGSGTAPKIMWYELGWLGTSQEARVVAGPVPPASEVAIGSNYIVWTQRAGGQNDIWGFDLQRGSRVQVTRTFDADETWPATSGPWITWQKHPLGSTTAEIEAIRPDVLEWDFRSVASADGVYNLRPSIDGDLIAWESNVTGNYDIFLYRLSDRQTFQVTNHTANQYLNDVFGNKVAFVDLRNGDQQDIYLASFNYAPVAGAGADQTVRVGSLVTLDGAGSTDPDLNYPLTFAWTLKQAPAGSTAALTGSETVTPSFTADVMGEYVVELVVTDAFGWPSLPDTVAVSTTNSAPGAATLKGRVLYNGNPVISYTTNPVEGWIRDEKTGQMVIRTWNFNVTDSTYSISDLYQGTFGVETHIFAPGVPGFFPGNYYGFKTPIIIEEGEEEVVVDLEITKLIHLTSPIDNNTLEQLPPPYDSYLWTNILFQWDAIAEAVRYEYNVDKYQSDPYLFIQRTLYGGISGTSAMVSLAPNKENHHYNFHLYAYNAAGSLVGRLMIVYDRGHGWDYRFVVGTTPESITQIIVNLEDTAFTNNAAQRKNALSNKLKEVQVLIDQGYYQQAIDKLMNDIRPKMDGCFGGTCSNDWITDCGAQGQLLPLVDGLIAYLQSIL